jgi:hypothetical protein
MRCSTKTAVVFLVALGAAYGQVSPADAVRVPIAITAQVRLVDDPGGFLGGAINVGDTVKGRYIYESTTPDTNPAPTVGDYQHTIPPFGIRLRVGGLVFRTDPSNVDFLVENVNDHAPGIPPRQLPLKKFQQYL